MRHRVYTQKTDLLRQAEEEKVEGKRRAGRAMRIWGGMNIYC